MKHIAILGGGIAGVSAAYELARQQETGGAVEFTLFEATHRLGGILETVHRDGFIVECGPDSWVTEKPWARELTVELGLESEIIFSQDERRRTYVAEDGALHAMPDGMRMMVPFEWASVLESPFFSRQAKLDYQREPQMAEQLKATALDASQSSRDESVKDFVIRHFGAEVAATIAAPLLASVFGGDIATLSARAVLPAYVALEREHGSLILGLQRHKNAGASTVPIFSTLRNGLSGLIERMEARIPAKNVRRGFTVTAIEQINDRWRVHGVSENKQAHEASEQFDAVIVATPAKTTAQLLTPLNGRMAELLPKYSSSAIVVALTFSAEKARSLQIPRGFGFLVSQRGQPSDSLHNSRENLEAVARQALLACTFVDQKFPHRVPTEAVLLRAFLGGLAAPTLLREDDATLSALTFSALKNILGKLPEPTTTLVRHWPDSLPLYAVGHLDRIAELESWVAQFPNIRLIGNAYRGVGLPDLIRDGRNAAREICAALAEVGLSEVNETS